MNMINENFEDAVSEAGDSTSAMSSHGAGVQGRLQQTMMEMEQRRRQTQESHDASQSSQDDTLFRRMINARPANISMASDDDEPEGF